MKIIRFLLNTLLFAFVLCLSMVGAIGVYSAISYQSTDDYAIIEFPIKEDNVSYLDSVMFWYDDIHNGLSVTDEVSTKMRVANWFDWQWWKTSMSNVDIYFVDPLVSIFKPIILPITCADEIRTYYDQDISNFIDYINRDTKSITDFTAMSATYFGVSVGFEDESMTSIKYSDLEKNKDVYTLNNLLGDRDQNGIKDLYDVASDYNYYYQLLFKLYKYNQTDQDGNLLYKKYYDKFIFEDEAGRHIKSSVYGLYVIEITALIFSCFFIWQNPITIRRTDDGSTEVAPPLRGFRRKHKESKK